MEAKIARLGEKDFFKSIN